MEVRGIAFVLHGLAAWFFILTNIACQRPEASTTGQSPATSNVTTSATATVLAAGWSKAINVQDPAYSVPLGLANAPISGTPVGKLVIDPKVAVRPDGNSCVSCHGGANTLRPEYNSATLSREDFCKLVPAFIKANKPQVLKDVFAVWYANGCPE